MRFLKAYHDVWRKGIAMYIMKRIKPFVLPAVMTCAKYIRQNMQLTRLLQLLELRGLLED